MRAARGLLNWSQMRLAEVAKVSISTIKRMEDGSGPVQATHENALKVTAAFEAAGVVFLSEPAPGVRLRDTTSEPVRAS